MKYLQMLIVFQLFLFCSCTSSLISHKTKYQKQISYQGYHPYHSVACGPEALQDVLTEFKMFKKSKDISKDIRDHGSLDYEVFRSILGIVHVDFLKITLPSEMENFLDRQGFYFNKIECDDIDKIYSHLNKSTIKHIVLLKERNGISYHWIANPPSKVAYVFFGKENTIIDSLYIVSKK